MTYDSELFAVFRAEVEEQLDELCSTLEREPEQWRVDRLFHLSHNIKGAARLVGVDAVRDAAHALEDLFGALRDGSTLGAEELALVREGADLLDAVFHTEEGEAGPDVDDYRERVSAHLGRAAPARPQERSEDAPAGAPAPSVSRSREKPSSSTLRVGERRLERVAELVSELVAASLVETSASSGVALLDQIAEVVRRHPSAANDPELVKLLRSARGVTGELVRQAGERLQIVHQLEDASRHLWMVPVESLRVVLASVVREASRESGRRAALTLEGGDTELDRSVLDRLRDPLVHLVRNAVVHGVEDSETRAAGGKPPEGAVTVTAAATGSWVEIAVADDGRGIDYDAVREAAVRGGRLSDEEAAAASRRELAGLLFQPGFTTAVEVSKLAGRGVGLDTVRAALATLGGTVEASDRRGGGTVFRLRSPLSRLSTTGLTALVSGQPVAVPILAVDRVVSVAREDVQVAEGREAVALEGALIPVVRLAAVLALPAAVRDTGPGLVVVTPSGRKVVLVDELLGEREMMIQPLPWNLEQLPGVAGTAVLDGGQIVLVLEPSTLGEKVREVGADEARGEERGVTTTVLVVDDSVTSRTLVRNILSVAGYEVVLAVDGVEALARLEERPDIGLVVADVEMPRMNGLELTRRIRELPERGELPVVLVTSLGSEEDRSAGAAAGADAYIIKGEFDQDELLRAVGRLVS